MASEGYQEQPIVNWGTPVTAGSVASWCAFPSQSVGRVPLGARSLADYKFRRRPDGSRSAYAPLEGTGVCGGRGLQRYDAGSHHSPSTLQGRPGGSRFAVAPLLRRCNGDRFSLEVLIDLTQKEQNKNSLSLILTKVRSFLAKYWHNGLFVWGITQVISSLLIIILFISVNTLPARALSDVPSESAETVSIPTAKEIINSDSTPEEVIEKTDTSSDETVSIPAEIETADAPVEQKQPESLKINKTPPPQPVITPEQILFSAIQEKISEITSQDYGELILSGEADLLAGRLLIKVSDDWYQMDKSSQDKFVNEALQRSQQFKIKKLAIQDLQNNLIARSPVVGNKMIILQREH